MNCPRCGSRMSYEIFYTLHGSHDYFWGWRCIFCGEIIDSMILENRLLDQNAPRRAGRR